MTSRDRLAGLVTNHGARPLAVGLLDDDAAGLLLGKPGRRRATGRGACGGVRVVGFLRRFPLALSLVAGRAQTRPRPSAVHARRRAPRRRHRLGVLDEDDPGAGVTAVLSCSQRH
ncbi:hypothetical protein GCM10018954_024480 [Kutzneria kofuensis]